MTHAEQTANFIPPHLSLLVLGGGVNLDGTLMVKSAFRVDRALPALLDPDVPHIFSGGYSVDGLGISEAEAMKQYAVDRGANPDAILVEDDSIDTFTNIVSCRDMLGRLSVQRFGYVTDSFHVPRVNIYLQRIMPAYMRFTAFASDYQSTLYDRGRELLAIPIARVSMIGVTPDTDMATRHKFYRDAKSKVRR